MSYRCSVTTDARGTISLAMVITSPTQIQMTDNERNVTKPTQQASPSELIVNFDTANGIFHFEGGISAEQTATGEDGLHEVVVSFTMSDANYNTWNGTRLRCYSNSILLASITITLRNYHGKIRALMCPWYRKHNLYRCLSERRDDAHVFMYNS